MEKILIIDDNIDIRQQVKWGLSQEFAVLQAGDVQEAMTAFRKHNPSVVILDLGLPPHPDSSEEGFRCLGLMLDHNPNVKVIMMTGNNERENALRAIQMGAYDFYPKPPVLSELRVIISRAFHLVHIEEQNRQLHSHLELQSVGSGDMVGSCPEMLAVFQAIRKVATSDVPVLITGESGTGKELVARAIHDASLKKHGPFIPINCGAIPENLLESELFGHEKGSFTGAHSTVQGKVQYAHRGTLFLDEIGEMPVNLQVKLLRFLQEGTIQRVGGREDIKIDTRIICATNIDIQKSICEGRFREDLYYRVGVINIALPPLRDRGDDILFLAQHFLKLFNNEHRKKVRRFSSAAINFLKTHNWPGNVRELRNKVQRAIIMTDATSIEPADLGADSDLAVFQAPPSAAATLREARDKAEQQVVSAALEQHHGNILKASEQLGISRPTLYDLMKKHGLLHANGGTK